MFFERDIADCLASETALAKPDGLFPVPKYSPATGGAPSQDPFCRAVARRPMRVVAVANPEGRVHHKKEQYARRLEPSDTRGMERSSKSSSRLAWTAWYALTRRWSRMGTCFGEEASNNVPGTGANGVTATKSMRVVHARISAENIVKGRIFRCIPCVLPLPHTTSVSSWRTDPRERAFTHERSSPVDSGPIHGRCVDYILYTKGMRGDGLRIRRRQTRS